MPKCFCCAQNIENETIILVCDTCNCYAHKICMDIYTFQCGDYVNNINCPLCNKILKSHPIDKTNISKAMYTEKISKIIDSITYGFYVYEAKLNLVKTLFDLVLDSKDILLKEEEKLSNTVKNKLINLYYDENWNDAEYYYRSLYDESLP